MAAGGFDGGQTGLQESDDLAHALGCAHCRGRVCDAAFPALLGQLTRALREGEYAVTDTTARHMHQAAVLDR